MFSLYIIFVSFLIAIKSIDKSTLKTLAGIGIGIGIFFVIIYFFALFCYHTLRPRYFG